MAVQWTLMCCPDTPPGSGTRSPAAVSPGGRRLAAESISKHHPLPKKPS